MTRHKLPEERVKEILEAAAEVIDEQGYDRLTMEKIIARTSLSKGGVYRFFGNKREVALALLRLVVDHWTRFEVDTVVGWNLPVRETILKLFFPPEKPQHEEVRNRRIWLHLLPATLRDPEFLAERNRQEEAGRERYRELVRALLQRDGLQANADFERTLERAISVGVIFMEGLMLVSLSHGAWDQLERTAHDFIDVVLRDTTNLLSAHAA